MRGLGLSLGYGRRDGQDGGGNMERRDVNYFFLCIYIQKVR